MSIYHRQNKWTSHAALQAHTASNDICSYRNRQALRRGSVRVSLTALEGRADQRSTLLTALQVYLYNPPLPDRTPLPLTIPTNKQSRLNGLAGGQDCTITDSSRRYCPLTHISPSFLLDRNLALWNLRCFHDLIVCLAIICELQAPAFSSLRPPLAREPTTALTKPVCRIRHRRCFGQLPRGPRLMAS
jgi:hypothetical protein